MQRMLQTPLRWVMVLFALLPGCGDKDLAALRPLLEMREDTPRDPAGRAEYVLQFGEVALGSAARRTLFLTNAGRSVLTVHPLDVPPPFLTSLAEPMTLAFQEEREVAFVFRPADLGAADQVVTFTSDGGSVTLRLLGVGVEPVEEPEEPCEYAITPDALDFGDVPRGATRTLSFRVTNLSDVDCTVTRLSLDPAGDDAFSFSDQPLPSRVIVPGEEMVVAVTFSPDRFSPGFTSKAQFWIGPPEDVVEIPLTGTAESPCPDVLPDGSCPVATELVYAHTATRLYSHDPVAGTTRVIGDFMHGSTRLTDMTDIGIDHTGRMVGVNSGVLYVIDASNARCTRKGNYGSAAPGLTFLPDGRLVLSGAVVDVVDLDTGAVLQRLVDANSGYSTSGDIVGLPDGKLYWSVSNGDRLVRIDPDTGHTQLVGSINRGSVYGLGYANGELYGYASNGDWLVIDHHTAQVKRSQRFTTGSGIFRTGITWWGAATNPVRW